MTSLQRAMRRALYRKFGKPWPSRQQPFVMLPDGGYKTLHPTRGWKRFCKRRLEAERAMGLFLGA